MYNIEEFSKLVDLSIEVINICNELDLLTPSFYDYNTKEILYFDIDVDKGREIKKNQLAGFSLYELSKSNGYITDKELLKKKRKLLITSPIQLDCIKNIDKVRNKRRKRGVN